LDVVTISYNFSLLRKETEMIRDELQLKDLVKSLKSADFQINELIKTKKLKLNVFKNQEVLVSDGSQERSGLL
jgi:hypothetical protein